MCLQRVPTWVVGLDQTKSMKRSLERKDPWDPPEISFPCGGAAEEEKGDSDLENQWERWGSPVIFIASQDGVPVWFLMTDLKGVDKNEKGSVEEIGRIAEGETIIRIYYMILEKPIFNKWGLDRLYSKIILETSKDQQAYY